MNNYYEFLGLTLNADQEEIQHAINIRLEALNDDAVDSLALYKQISVILLDADSRLAYDLALTHNHNITNDPEIPKSLKEHFRGLGAQLVPAILAILFTIILTIYRKKIIAYAGYGYLGIVVACFAANSTVFLPAPSSAIVIAFANVFTPFWVAVAGALGATLGEFVGYFAGISGRKLVENTKQARRMYQWVDRLGGGAVFILAFVPLPLFDLVGVIAGALRMSFWKFSLYAYLGKQIKMFGYAYLGYELIPILESLWLDFVTK